MEKYSVGYIKDGFAFIMFLASFCIVYLVKDLNSLKHFVLFGLFCGSVVDGLFTFYPDFHKTIWGHNLPTYILLLFGFAFLSVDAFLIPFRNPILSTYTPNVEELDEF